MYWFLLMWKLCVWSGGRGEGGPSLSLIGSYQSIIWANQQGNRELPLRLMIAV